MTKENTATMMNNCHCEDCGWPVIHTCCNDAMTTFEVDYWIYCSNKCCKHHGGEGSAFGKYPDFIVRTKK